MKPKIQIETDVEEGVRVMECERVEVYEDVMVGYNGEEEVSRVRVEDVVRMTAVMERAREFDRQRAQSAKGQTMPEAPPKV